MRILLLVSVALSAGTTQADIPKMRHEGTKTLFTRVAPNSEEICVEPARGPFVPTCFTVGDVRAGRVGKK